MALIGLPSVMDFESPASWMTRAALSQGVTYKEFRKFLNLHKKTDADLAFTQRFVRHVVRMTGMWSKSFLFSQHMLTSLRAVDRHGTEYLLGHGQTAQYRYCPVCLAESRVKHFQLHWRFKAWRWCPLHFCMMRDLCPNCEKPVMLPGEMLQAGPDRSGTARLDRCLNCLKSLTVGWQKVQGTLKTPGVVLPWEATLLDNGRAVLAALYHRKVLIDGEEGEFPLSGVRRIERSGLLPHSMFKLDHDEIMRRIQKRIDLGKTDLLDDYFMKIESDSLASRIRYLSM